MLIEKMCQIVEDNITDEDASYFNCVAQVNVTFNGGADTKMFCVNLKDGEDLHFAVSLVCKGLIN